MQYCAETNTFCLRLGIKGLALVSPGFAQHIRFVVIIWDAFMSHRNRKFNLLKLCPRLRTLGLLINPSSFFTAEWKDICSGKDQDYAKTRIMKAFALVRGLEHFDLDYEYPFGLVGVHVLIESHKWVCKKGSVDATTDDLKARLYARLEELVVGPRSA